MRLIRRTYFGMPQELAPQSISADGVSTKVVAHGLGYRPQVWFENSSGVIYTATEFSVTHNSDNQFTVSFGETVTDMTIWYSAGNSIYYFAQTVTSVSTFTKTHNLGYKPEVWFENSSGVVLTPAEYTVTHNSINEFVVTFGETVTNITVHWR